MSNTAGANGVQTNGVNGTHTNGVQTNGTSTDPPMSAINKIGRRTLDTPCRQVVYQIESRLSNNDCKKCSSDRDAGVAAVIDPTYQRVLSSGSSGPFTIESPSARGGGTRHVITCTLPNGYSDNGWADNDIFKALEMLRDSLNDADRVDQRRARS